MENIQENETQQETTNEEVNKDDKEELLKQKEEELRKIAEEKAKLEGMVEAMKTVATQSQVQNQQPVWTEEQWREFEEKTGFTKEQLLVMDNLTKLKVDEVVRQMEEKIKQAEEKALQAEKKLKEIETHKTLDNSIDEYFKNKPSFLRYKDKIKDFIKDYSEEVLNNPDKLKSVLQKAETYVKGYVSSIRGENMKFNKSFEAPEEKEEEVDLSGLKPHEKFTIERRMTNLTKDNLELLKKYQHDLKGAEGVMISSREEFEAAERDMRGSK